MTTAVLATPPFLAFYDLNGNPLAGGLVYTYAAGTTTPKATYTDESATVSMPNPIVLDSAGRATWWIIGAYKYVVKDALGNTIATTDNVTSFSTLAAAGSAFFQSFSGDGSTTAFTLSTDEGTDSKGLMIFVNSGLVSDIANGNFATDSVWTKGAGWTIGSGVATATGAISTAISQTATQTLVQGRTYAVNYTITRSAGSLTCSIGGQNGVAQAAAGTFSEVIVAGATQTIAWTGTGFTGTLSNITVTLVSSGGYQILNPNAYTINGTSLTFASAPSTGSNNIFVFAPSSLLGAASSAAALAQGYAAEALTSQTAAAISASSAAAYAAAKNNWTYSTTTTMSDPGTGNIRLNNATIASATAIAISNLSANSGNPDLSAWVATWDDSLASTRGNLFIFKDNGNFAIFNITGANVDNSGWKQITVTYSAGAGSWSNSDALLIGFTSAGTVTVTGGITALTGDVTGSGSGSVPTTIANSAVTLAKIANASANSKLLGSGASGSGAAYSEINLGTGLSMTSGTLNNTSLSPIKAWAKVTLSGTTATIQAQFNIASITRNSTGDFTVAFTNNMNDANYTLGGSSQYTTTNGQMLGFKNGTTPTVSSFEILTYNSNNTLSDPASISLIIVGN